MCVFQHHVCLRCTTSTPSPTLAHLHAYTHTQSYVLYNLNLKGIDIPQYEAHASHTPLLNGVHITT